MKCIHVPYKQTILDNNILKCNCSIKMFDWNPLKRSWSRLSSSGKKRPLTSPSGSSQPPLPFKDLGNVIKAPLDEKRYKIIQLKNGLKICLVSTCEVKTSEDSVLSKLKPSLFMNSRPRLLVEQEIITFNKELMKTQGITQPQSIAPAASKSSYSSFLSPSPMKFPKLGKSSKGPSSVCVCVGAGSLHDPWQTNGLAQLVEHLIFLGSKQYPEPNTLLTKVYDNGGIVNASTDLEYTNFYFQCNALAFEECVSILVDGLTNPLFKCKAIKNAIQTIDSEYMSNKAQDINLMGDFLRNLVASGHPLRKSCRGNKETLHKFAIIDEVLSWKQRYYRANYMTVCIQSPMSIEELERFAVKHFSDIPNCPSSWNWKSPSAQLTECEEPYTKENFQKVYFIAPLTEMNCLMITWALPANFWKNYECKPLEYIRLLLENTSKGGLQHYLRKKHWISEWGNVSVNRCSADDYYRNAYCSIFEVTIILTDEGYEKRFEVVQTLFSYLKKLRREGVGLHRFEEIQMNMANKFHYQNWEEMLQSGAEIAVNMQRVDKASHLLTSMNLITRFSPDLIDEALASMLPRAANFIFTSHKNSPYCEETTPCGRIRYSKQESRPEWYSYLEDVEILKDFVWPEYKHFMPREICLRTGGAELKRIGTHHKDKKLTVEYLSENKTSWLTPQVPSASIFVHFSSPTVSSCKMKQAVLEYWTRLMCDRIVANAGHQFDDHFTFGVKVVDDGITVHVAGPRCHLVYLLVMVVQEFFGRFGLDDGIDGGREVAQNLKLDLIQESTNEMFDVEILSKDILSSIQHESYMRQSEIKDRLKKMLANGYCHWQIFLNLRREMLVNVKLHGCLTTGDLNGIVRLLSGKSHNIVNYSLPTPRASSCLNANRVTLLPVGTRRLPMMSLQPAHVSSVTTNFYQMDGWRGQNQNARNYLAVLHALLRRHIVKKLITREQLGYNIRLVPLTNAPLGLCVTILTLPHKHAPYHVDARIDLFFRQFYEQILRSEKTQTFLKKHCFKGKEGVDKLIVGLEHFYRDNLLKEGSNFRKLSIQLQGYLPEAKGDSDCSETIQYLMVDDERKNKLKSEGVEIIANIAEFKDSLAKLKAIPN